MAATPTVDDDASRPSCLSSTAQTRILIWRSEVASAFDSPPSPSSASTTSAPSTATTAAAAAPSCSQRRRPRFWRRLVRRLSPRAPGVPDPDADPDEDDDLVRTAMYRAAPLPHAAPLPDDEVRLGEPSSKGGARGGALKEKQERLHRAARLLMQQNAKGIPAALAP